MSLIDKINLLSEKCAQEDQKNAAAAASALSAANSALTQIGTMGSLTTTAKDTLVNAINELVTSVGNIDFIDDTQASTDKTYSSSKIASEILASANQVKSDLLNGAGEAYDTLKELADLIKENQSAIDSLETLAAGHVKYSEAQTLTDEQKTTARSNIGAASTTEVTAVSTELTNFKTAVGNTDTDFVATYTAAYNAAANPSA